jgi:hypothetical protein
VVDHISHPWIKKRQNNDSVYFNFCVSK